MEKLLQQRVGVAREGAVRPLPSIDALASLRGRERVSCPEDELHLWYCHYERVRVPHLLDAYDGLLTDEEREKHSTFAFENDRHEYLVTRALVRSVLSRYAPVALERWEFGKNAHGRPFVLNPEFASLTFNLSHSKGLVVCAVSRGSGEMGVDVEDTEQSASALEVGDGIFSPAEACSLNACPAELRQARFFWYWTLKEAYAKARGVGMSIPLDQVSFSFDEPSNAPDRKRGPTVRVAFEPSLREEASRWHFGIFRASRRHVLAYGMKSRQGWPPAVYATETIPLEGLRAPLA